MTNDNFVTKEQNDTQITLLERNWRMSQMWDWGHNCKIMGHTQEQAQQVVDSFEMRHTREEWDRFWEGYNAPRSRATLVSIKV
jgi:hypothetical protein